MFLDTPGPELRQGDVCAIRAFPLWDMSVSAEVITPDGLQHLQVPAWSRVIELENGRLVAVCSHDCDVENPRARTGILIAPIVRVPASEADDRFERIMASGSPHSGAFDYINLFPVAFDDLKAVVDFSAITTVARASDAVRTLLNGKKAEMGIETRASFRRKLAAFVGRP